MADMHLISCANAINPCAPQEESDDMSRLILSTAHSSGIGTNNKAYEYDAATMAETELGTGSSVLDVRTVE
jgi:hypothetical protein